MDQSVDIQFGASTGGLGGDIREVVSSIHSVRDAVDALGGFLDGLKQGFREALDVPADNGAERTIKELQEEVRELRGDLERTQREMRETANAGGGLGEALGGVKRMAVGMLAGIGVVEVGRQIVETASQFEKLRGVLQTLEPAQGVAAARFEDLRKLAATTPFSLEEVVTAFSKLKAMGLDPSSAAITSYGNTASAMGKSLDQMIEAVADAATGEFERLKEFGIKSKQQGDNVTFTFQGVSTTVKKNSEDIQEYLRKIGDVNFAGAMERQSATFGGMMSNLSDNVANVANEIGQGGLMDALKGIVTDMNNASGSSGDWAKILGGVLGTTITSIWEIIKTLGEVIASVFHTCTDIIRSFTGSTQSDGNMIKTVIMAIQLTISGLGSIVQITFTVIGGILSWAVNTFISAADAINKAMNWDFSGAVAAVEKWGSDTVNTASKTWAEVERLNKEGNERLAKIQAPAKKEDAAVALPGYVAPTSSPAAAKKATGGNAAADRLQMWQEELHQMEISSGDFFRDNTQQELEFWQKKLALTNSGSKDWAAVQDKIYAASKTLAQQRYQEQIASLDFELQSANGNYARQAEIEQRKVDLIRTTYGEQSAQYRNALREQERMAQQHEDELRRIRQQGIQQRQAIEEEAAQTDLQIQQAQTGQLSAILSYQEGAGLIGRRAAAAERARIAMAEFEAERDSQERIYQMRLQSLRDQLALEGLKPAEIARINADIEKAEATHEQRMRLLSTQQASLIQRANLDAANATRQVWMDRLAPVTQALTGMVNGFLQGTTSVRQAMLQMGSQILQNLNSWVMQWVQQHVAGQQAATAATVAGTTARTAANTAAAVTQAGTTAATATGEITTNAAVAGSGALASISKIPVIGPFIAPAIAAGILALAMGFIGKIASAEGGWDQVPYDGMQTELHKDEMVLPASIASPLRDALASKDSTWTIGATGLASRQVGQEMGQRGDPAQSVTREGDTHFHLSALDTRTGVDWLMRNRRDIGKALGKAYREGSR